MKFLYITFLSLITFWATAQDSTSTLRVKGNSELSVKPTRTVISFTIKSINPTYAGSVEELIKRVDILTKVLTDIKFKEHEIITSNFSVNKNRIYVEREWKDSGFVAVQTLKVQFEQDKKRLLEVLNTSTSSKADPEISLSFELDNDRKLKLKSELIKLAVRDAKTKAELIANEAGYQIIGIKEINYGIGYSAPDELYAVVDMEYLEVELDVEISNFEVSNLTFSDFVNVVFSIKQK